MAVPLLLLVDFVSISSSILHVRLRNQGFALLWELTHPGNWREVPTTRVEYLSGGSMVLRFCIILSC